jgi:hypothetical protein
LRKFVARQLQHAATRKSSRLHYAPGWNVAADNDKASWCTLSAVCHSALNVHRAYRVHRARQALREIFRAIDVRVGRP